MMTEPAGGTQEDEFPIPRRERRKRRRRRADAASPGALWLARTLAVAWLAVLLVLAALGQHQTVDVRPIGLGDVRHTHYLVGWLSDVAKAATLAIGCFLPVGFLAVLALPSQGRWYQRLFKVALPALVLSLLAALLVVALESPSESRWPGALRLLAPAVGSLLGVWLGSTWRRGWDARLWFFPRLALAAALLALGAAAALFLAIEPHPLSIELGDVSAGEKRRLRDSFRNKNPRTVPEGETRTLRLTQLDLDQLGAWATALDGNPERKARFELKEDRVTLHASLGLPTNRIRRRFLNLTAGGEIAIDDGRPVFYPETLRLGRLDAPAWLLDLISPLAMRLVRNDYRVQTLLQPVKQLRIHQQALEVTYGRMELPQGFLADLLRTEGSGDDEKWIPEVRAYVHHILQLSQYFPKGDARFGAALETAFALARQRSLLGDPVAENKAAILALGMMLGHWRVEQPIGKVLDQATRDAARLTRQGATLRGRADWVQHFLVSASLTVFISEGFSMGSGLLKEELDAQGGSGFSFGDLCADRAGTMFATVAIADETKAEALQMRLAHGFRVDDFFPPAKDLPEDLQDTELEQRFGGVGGEGYLALLAEIERRVAAAPAYRDGVQSQSGR